MTTNTDLFEDARESLFPPWRSRKLADAADALSNGRPDLAELAVKRFLEKHPRDPAALNLMADIARRSKRYEEARDLLADCLDLAPDCEGYRYNYAIILRQLEKQEDALAQIEILLKDDPKNILFRDQKGKLLRDLGRFSETLDSRRALVDDAPDQADFWLRYGDILWEVGHGEEAISAYHRAVALNPDLTTAYLRLSDLKTYSFSDGEIEAMAKCLTQPGFAAEKRTDIHFALAQALGQKGDYEKSFQHYAKANALRHLAMPDDSERLTSHRRNLQSLFTKEFFEARAGWGFPTRSPIFIVSLPRSGSTLVEQILSSHSAIEGLGELPFVQKILGKKFTLDSISNNYGIIGVRDALHQYSDVICRMNSLDASKMGEEYLKLASSIKRTDRLLFTDKSVSSFTNIGFIHLILPHAKIIDVRRHPLACGWSCFTNHFPRGMPFSYRLDDIGKQYENYVRLMDHFSTVLPGKIHRLIYENLVNDTENEIRRLLSYLELPFDKGCLRFHENRRAVTTLSSDQVRAPMNRNGMSQWQAYEKWLGPLKKSLGPIVEYYPNTPLGWQAPLVSQ